MSKKLNNLKWESVALEGFPASLKDNFQGFVGLEECTSYGLDKETKRSKKKKEEKKRKVIEKNDNEVPKKKLKLTNGFVVETCNPITPSQTNEIYKENKKNKKGIDKTGQIKNGTELKKEKYDNADAKSSHSSGNDSKKKIQKTKLGNDITEVVSELTAEDMLTWAEFKLPDSIMRALTELDFKKPTKIQELVLPAAIHGRRDILGAAETGSGKTLAFGLPILSGILKLKEKAELIGLDVYDIPYKKSSNKKKNAPEDTKTMGKGNKKANKTNKNDNIRKEIDIKKVIDKKPVVKESSEDGYSSNDETKGDDDDFIEEIEVPVRKRDNSADEGHESDDSENYVHLSDMLDSDDLAESDSANEEEQSDNDAEESDTNEVDSDNDEDASDSLETSDGKVIDDAVSEEESEDEDDKTLDEGDENEQGIGCVRVIDNIEIPGHMVVKTGKPLYALILTPTRELAIQISRHLIAVAKYTGIRIATIVGGMAAVKQERVLRSGPEVVVATPGRLWELLTHGQTHLQQIDSIKFLAIDETDRMIERGHFDELQPLLERLNADDERRNQRQNFVFSATLTLVHDLPSHMKGKKVTKRGKIINRKIEKMTPQQKVARLVKMIGMSDPKVVDITASNSGTAESLTESRITCSLEHKDAYLYYILKRHPGRTIVFCNSIGSVKRLAQLFTILKCRPLPLHASMPQRQRLKNLERFRDDPHGVLIATDVAARGLDIPNVDHVIHYQVPRTGENYVHRSGRTARRSKEGLAILLVEPSEAHRYNNLCSTLNKTAEVPTFPVSPQTLSSLLEVVKVARECDALLLRRRRAAQAHGWRDKAAREMDMIIDDDDVPLKEMDPTIDKAVKAKQRQLDSLLSRPLYPRGFSFKYPTLNEPDALNIPQEDALQVMKKSLETGQLKKEKRKSKNSSLLKLQKTLSKK